LLDGFWMQLGIDIALRQILGPRRFTTGVGGFRKGRLRRARMMERVAGAGTPAIPYVLGRIANPTGP
jgi:hypothetical protein